MTGTGVRGTTTFAFTVRGEVVLEHPRLAGHEQHVAVGVERRLRAQALRLVRWRRLRRPR